MVATRVLDFAGTGLATAYLFGAFAWNGLQDAPNWVGSTLTSSLEDESHFKIKRDETFQHSYLTGSGCDFAKSLSVYWRVVSISDCL
jgi:hypothetical protein